MKDIPSRPKLRWPLDIRMERIDNEQAIFMNCPLGVSKTPLLLIPQVGQVLFALTGDLELAQLAERFGPVGFSLETIAGLTQLLDEHLFLESPRFHQAFERLKQDFLEADARPAALAGLSYSGTSELLAREIDAYLARGVASAPKIDEQMIGLVAPHIDYSRGGDCYGATYQYLRQESHDLYIVLGTAHQYSSHLFHLTAKNFETPLGILPTDRHFVGQLASLYGNDRSFADELLHRREHSLELQLPFLKRLSEDSTIVPILIGGFHRMLASHRLPNEYDEYESFAASLAECVADRLKQGVRVCFLCGVDMAHVGRQFGDPEELTEGFMSNIRTRDLEYLKILERRDKVELFEHIAVDQDRRRICGFPTMYTALDVLERLGLNYTARTFDYRQAVNVSAGCAVTFAGMGFYQQIAP